MATMN